MHPVSIAYVLLSASSSFALPLGLNKLVRAWKDHDLDLPTVHLDTPEPVSAPIEDPEFYGFSWADEWRGGKRSLHDKHDDPIHDVPNKGDLFHGIDPGLPKVPPPVVWGPSGLIFKDAAPPKRDLFGDIVPDLLEAPDSTPPQTESHPKGLMFKDAAHNKRDETLTEVVDGIIQPSVSEASDESTPDPMFASAPHKRDETSDAPLPELVGTEGSLFIFKDAPFKRHENSEKDLPQSPDSLKLFVDAPHKRDGRILARIKDAVRGFLT